MQSLADTVEKPVNDEIAFFRGKDDMKQFILEAE